MEKPFLGNVNNANLLKIKHFNYDHLTTRQPPLSNFEEVLEMTHKDNLFTEYVHHNLIKANRDVNQAKTKFISMSLSTMLLMLPDLGVEPPLLHQ